ncbi:MAG: NAD-dependent epimerase/dehydratase family protein [Polyangia bacterium]|jgi:nucleoside-diphosphate-sugar epimerase|nr:NAD-dependent epimerase/dehydratase family protein [Polyangia bacterium]
MIVAVTGVSSRLGAELVAALDREERVTAIVGLDRVAPGFGSSKLRFVRRDIRDEELRRDLRGCDAVFHLAFLFQPPLPHMAEVHSINVDGSKNLCDAALCSGTRKLLITSSVAAYGAFPDNPVPIGEDRPIRLMEPEFYYNACKYRVEMYLDVLEAGHPELQVTRFRPCTILGRCHSHAMSRRVYLSPCPDVPMQFLWVDDMVSALMLGLMSDARGAFNIAGDHPMTWREVAAQTGKRSISIPYRPTLWFAELTSRLGLQRHLPPGWLRMARYPVVMDCTKARRELGWAPLHDTPGAVRQFHSWNSPRGG